MGESDWDVWVEMMDKAISWFLTSLADIFNFHQY